MFCVKPSKTMTTLSVKCINFYLQLYYTPSEDFKGVAAAISRYEMMKKKFEKAILGKS